MDINVENLTDEQIKRAFELLEVTKKLITKSIESPIVVQFECLTETWDDAECDGYCLNDDIGHLMDEINQE